MIPRKKIKIILIDDSPIVLVILKRILSQSEDIEILGTAKNGEEGLRLVESLNPDVVCTDLMMPIMDGLEFTKKLMETNPKPILVISSAAENETNVFNLLQAGAIDIYQKPKGSLDSDYSKIAPSLITKVQALNGLPVYKKHSSTSYSSNSFPSSFSIEIPEKKIEDSYNFMSTPAKGNYRYLAIGASTGGPPAIQTVLSNLSNTISTPILCVQHISEGFTASLIDWLNSTTKFKCKIMTEGETPIPGYAYFPIEGTHMVMTPFGSLASSYEAPYNGHIPSVNVLFHSMAKNFASHVLGVILTGMGDDGANGLLAIRNAGGHTIGEAESSCIVYGMPRVAYEVGAVNVQVPLNDIANRIMQVL